MNKQSLLTFLKQRRDSLQTLVDKDFGGGVAFNYMGALREIKYLIVFVEVLNRFDGDEPETEGKATINLNEKQIGTLVAAMQVALANRDALKKTAKTAEVKNLNNIDDELKLAIALHSLIKENE